MKLIRFTEVSGPGAVVLVNLDSIVTITPVLDKPPTLAGAQAWCLDLTLSGRPDKLRVFAVDAQGDPQFTSHQGPLGAARDAPIRNLREYVAAISRI